jgi:ATP-dependent DNA helicase 2 subunit 2
MREECYDKGVEEIFNDFIRDLKTKLLGGELNGDRTDMWFDIRRDKQGLILKTEDNPGGASKEEADEFLKAK